MEITYRLDIIPDTKQIIEVYESSGINRPTTDTERISKMYDNSNLVVIAWDNDKLVGVSRSLTDFFYWIIISLEDQTITSQSLYRHDIRNLAKFHSYQPF